MDNPLLRVQRFGQSIWYDNIRRGLITSGELQAMVDQDGLLGVTSNPAIFEKAVAGSPDYDPQLKGLVAQGVKTAQDLYERVATQDIQLAADVLYPVWMRTQGVDGWVSFEVSPYLARDARGTVEEARRLHRDVARENVLIKIPATPEGIPAIETCIGEGIPVNVTLLFAVEPYEQVARAYMAGMKRFLDAGGDPTRIASVASFFVSRIDSVVDERIARALEGTRDARRRARLESLPGKVAIANARGAYERWQELCATPEWKALAARGARTQRLLWASTGTKNPAYPPALYVDELIGPDTVNTVPAETYAAYRNFGRPRPALVENWAESVEEARDVLERLETAGISLKEITDHLLADAVQKFADAFDKLLAAVERKRQALLGGELASQRRILGEAEKPVAAALDRWRAEGRVRRLWAGDASLWTEADEAEWLGWLHVVQRQIEAPERYARITEEVRGAGFRHVLLLGMGGASLCADVLARSFGRREGFPELRVLDSTLPAEILAREAGLDPGRTLFLVSSKSGGTAEVVAFRDTFLARAREAVGDEEAGSRFVAITDPGTSLDDFARAEGFRHVEHGIRSIGGRFSALSAFGLVPAAAMGLDVPAFLESAETMVQACASCVPPEANPGVSLGVTLGTLAQEGRDKPTLVVSPAIASLGAWIEQLLAGSTGKQGRGLVPVDREPLGPPEAYGEDRVFVYVRLATAPSAEQDAAVDAFEKAGRPVLRIDLADTLDLGQEFFRWQIAAAVAGSILGVHPFGQPDVEAGKLRTRRLVAEAERSGKLPEAAPFLTTDGLHWLADPANAEALGRARGSDPAGLLAAHLGRLRPGDYFALNAFVAASPENDRELQAIRRLVRDARGVATTLGYGPRLLHSTGQLHKGGPDCGVFLQVTSRGGEDRAIPGRRLSFGMLCRAQALGDLEVLGAGGRRALGIDLGAEVTQDLARLRGLVEQALA